MNNSFHYKKLKEAAHDYQVPEEMKRKNGKSLYNSSLSEPFFRIVEMFPFSFLYLPSRMSLAFLDLILLKYSPLAVPSLLNTHLNNPISQPLFLQSLVALDHPDYLAWGVAETPNSSFCLCYVSFLLGYFFGGVRQGFSV
jgi:hypothetical protein